jgi:LacI family transcriptional regulator
VVIQYRRNIPAAVGHFAFLGHTRIALLTGKPHMRRSRERMEGYKEGLAADGDPLGHSSLRQGFGRASAGPDQ